MSVSLPLFAGGGVQSQVREKAALRDAARDDLETARRTAEQSVRTAYLGVTAGAAQVQARQNVLASSESQLAAKFGSPVSITENKTGKGHLSIDFASPDELNRILDLLGVNLDD